MMRTGIQMSKALSGIADFGLCCEFGAPQRVMNDNIMCCAPVVVEEGRRQQRMKLKQNTHLLSSSTSPRTTSN